MLFNVYNNIVTTLIFLYMEYAYCKSLKSYNIQHLMHKIIDLLTIQNLLQYIHKE